MRLMYIILYIIWQRQKFPFPDELRGICASKKSAKEIIKRLKQEQEYNKVSLYIEERSIVVQP